MRVKPSLFNRSVSLSHTHIEQEDFLLGPLSLPASLVSEEWHSWAISLQNRKWVRGQKWLGAGEKHNIPSAWVLWWEFLWPDTVSNTCEIAVPYTKETRPKAPLAAVPDSHPEESSRSPSIGGFYPNRELLESKLCCWFSNNNMLDASLCFTVQMWCY